jgi:hypothetical protein
MTEPVTVEDALRQHYAASGLPADGGRFADTWTLKLEPLSLRLRNFEWRQRALQRHDVHHLLTGYACTPIGEMEMAAWEFAAGPFPSVLSTAFCLPLVAVGALIAPRRSFAAFARGRRSRTLYALPSSPDLASLALSTLRSDVVPAEPYSITFTDLALYGLLVASSAALLSAPLALLSVFG